MLLVVGPYKFGMDTGGQVRLTADMPDGPPQSLVIAYDHVTDFFRFMGMVEQLTNYYRRAPLPAPGTYETAGQVATTPPAPAGDLTDEAPARP